MNISIVILLITSIAWSALPTTCQERLASGPWPERLKFGDIYDAYLEGKKPEMDNLFGKDWKLVGFASSAQSDLSYGSSYEPRGYEVEMDVVPRLEFVARSILGLDPDYDDLLSWNNSEHFVMRRNWGGKNQSLRALPSFFSDSWEVPEKKGALVFWYEVAKGGPFSKKKLGPLWNAPPRTTYYYYCRETRGALVCLIETFDSAGKIVDGAIFEPQNSAQSSDRIGGS